MYPLFRAPEGTLGELDIEPTMGGKNEGNTITPYHKHSLPGRPTASMARGWVAIEGRVGRPRTP